MSVELEKELVKLSKMLLKMVEEDIERAEERKGVLEKWIETYDNQAEVEKNDKGKRNHHIHSDNRNRLDFDMVFGRL